MTAIRNTLKSQTRYIMDLNSEQIPSDNPPTNLTRNQACGSLHEIRLHARKQGLGFQNPFRVLGPEV